MRKIITLIKYLWILAVIVFVSSYFYKNFDSIVNILYVIPLFNLVIAFCSLFLAKVLLSYVALYSVKYVGISLPFSKIFSIYNITQLAKYIPGSIWQFVGKSGAYANEGMAFSVIKKCIFIEVLWVLSSAFVLGMILVLSGDILDIQLIISRTQQYFFFYGVLFITVFSIAAYYYKKTLSLLSLLAQNISLNVKMFSTLFFVWFLLGMSFFITLTPYIDNSSLSLYIDIVGLYALAYAIGFLVPFAPAGIGIREAILVAGLTSVLSAEHAIVLASLNRAVYIILEVIIVVMIMLYKYVRKQ